MQRHISLFLLLAIGQIWAHPHIFVDSRLSLDFDASGLRGVRNHWTFDLLYSQAILAGLDADHNGKLSPAEQQRTQKEVIEPMKRFNYFNHVVLGSAFLEAPKLLSFEASIDKGRLNCSFVLPYRAPAGADYSMLLVVLADPANYTQMTAMLDSTRIEAPRSLEVEWFVDQVGDMTLFKGLPMATQGVFLRFRQVKK